MIYSSNLTNKELLQNAIQLKSLSRKHWNTILKHLENIERSEDKVLFEALSILCTNQSKTEILNNYLDYYSDTLEEPVREQSLDVQLM